MSSDIAREAGRARVAGALFLSAIGLIITSGGCNSAQSCLRNSDCALGYECRPEGCVEIVYATDADVFDGDLIDATLDAEIDADTVDDATVLDGEVATDGDVDVDADVPDADLDAGPDADLDADLDAGPDADLDADLDAATDATMDASSTP